MRRQARISAGGALVVRTASALQVWLWLLIFIFQNKSNVSGTIQPGYLDFDNLPETNFTCAGKVIGGYYADLETSCQMFHVCTVGQQDEPMDIKFLCLNGTVFDQETRVCERVDEVDCTKSEKFYSLNLELYGSTLAPPVIQDQPKPQAQPTEQSIYQTKPDHDKESSYHDKETSYHDKESSYHDEAPTTSQDKNQEHTEPIDSTDDPILDIKKDSPKHPQDSLQTRPIPIDNEELDDYEEVDEYEDDYSQSSTTQASHTTTTMKSTTTVSTTKKPLMTTILQSTLTHRLPILPHLITSPSPTVSSAPPSTVPVSIPVTSTASSGSSPTVDPSLLSPQQFIYHNRGPGSEAISFQRQSFRPADGVYITHAPPQQYDHFQYESSRTAPRPAQSRPTAFVQRPQPAPFRATTLDPRDQLIRPGPSSQPSERHETAIKHRPMTYPSVLPAQRPLPFNPYYYDRKRSEDSSRESESLLSARSVPPPIVSEKPIVKPKSPPRVIVTASASVSDSNGKRLNYTVGNVVSAVKPIVAINYDDYKESDLIFDPFFLDVPKLQSRRKVRSNKNGKIIAVPATATVSSDLVISKVKLTTPSITSQATTTDRTSTTVPTTTATFAWNPNDYVDDNYEPHAYVPPVPLAVLRVLSHNKYTKQERLSQNDISEKNVPREQKSKISRIEELDQRPTSSAVLTISSHPRVMDELPSAASPPPAPPPPLKMHCALSSSTDCHTRA